VGGTPEAPCSNNRPTAVQFLDHTHCFRLKRHLPTSPKERKRVFPKLARAPPIGATSLSCTAGTSCTGSRDRSRGNNTQRDCARDNMYAKDRTQQSKLSTLLLRRCHLSVDASTIAITVCRPSGWSLSPFSIIYVSKYKYITGNTTTYNDGKASQRDSNHRPEESHDPGSTPRGTQDR
jgi:hypothetical protein